MANFNLDPQSFSDPSKTPSGPPSPSSNQPRHSYSISSPDSRPSFSRTPSSLSEEVHKIDEFAGDIFTQMGNTWPSEPGKESDNVYARFSISSIYGSSTGEESSKLSTSSAIETNPYYTYDVEGGDDEPSVLEKDGPGFTMHEPPPAAATDLRASASVKKSPKEKNRIFESFRNLFKS